MNDTNATKTIVEKDERTVTRSARRMQTWNYMFSPYMHVTLFLGTRCGESSYRAYDALQLQEKE